MLSLSRCPTKKRQKKKSSSLPPSSVSSKHSKNCIASTKSDDEDHCDDKISWSSTQVNIPVLQNKEIEPLKENQKQQLQLLKRQRERQKRRRTRMESAFECILQPAIHQSDSSELKRMEHLFWNDDDLENKDVQKQEFAASSSDNNPTHSDGLVVPQSVSEKMTTGRKRSRPSIPNFSDPLFEEPSKQCSGGRKEAMPEQAKQQSPSIRGSGTATYIEGNTQDSSANVDIVTSSPSTSRVLKRSSSIYSSKSTSEEIVDLAKHPEFSGAKKTLSIKLRNSGEDVSFHKSDQQMSAGKKSPVVQLDKRVPRPKQKVGWQPASTASRVDNKNPSSHNEPESGGLKLRDEVPSSCAQTKCERPAGFESGHNEGHPRNHNNPRSPTNDNDQRSRGNDDLSGKLVIAKQFCQKSKNEDQLTFLAKGEIDTSRAGAQHSKREEIPQSSRHLPLGIVPPEQEIATLADWGSLRDGVEETCMLQHQETTHLSREGGQDSITLVSQSLASHPQSSSIGTLKVEAVAEEGKVASDGKVALSKKKPCQGLVKKTQGAAPESTGRGCVSDQKKTLKKSQRVKKRGRGLCALCTTCPCRKLGGDDNFATLGLQSFARSDGAMEKVLIRRLKKIEKSSERLQDQQEVLKRKLKKHRRDLLRQKTKVSPEDNDASYFLPEVELLESSECKASKMTDDWVTLAQNKIFPSALDDNQQSLTQLGFLASASNKHANTISKTLHAHVSTLPEERIESVVDEIVVSRSTQCNEQIEIVQDSEISCQELITGDRGTKDERCAYVKPHRISWRSGLKSASIDSNDWVAASALEGLVVLPEEAVQVDDANSVLSLTHDECLVGRTEPCPWDSLFADCAMGDEICDIDQLLKLIVVDKSAVKSTQEATTCRIRVVGDSLAGQLDLTQGGEEAAKALIAKISSNAGKVEALNQVCPSWKENVSFAFGQSKEEIQNAVLNLKKSRRRLDQIKQMIMGAWDRNKMTMEIFQEALEMSLDQHES